MTLVEHHSERYLAGMVAMRPQAMSLVLTAQVRPEMFRDKLALPVMQTAHDLFVSGRLTGAEVVRAELEARNLFMGEDKWRNSILATGWDEHDDHLPYHLDRVHRAYLLREASKSILDAQDELISESRDLDVKQAAVSKATRELLKLTAQRKNTVAYSEDIADNFTSDLDSEIAKVLYTPTGISALDEKIGGMPNSRITIVAARPSHGKSAAGTQIALNVARRHLGHEGQVLYFNAELGENEMRPRIIANLSKDFGTGVNSRRIEAHLQGDSRLNDAEMGEAKEAAKLLRSLPITFDYESSPDTAYMRARIMSESARQPVKLVVFDYLEFTGEKARSDRKDLVLEEALRGCHEIAKEFDIPFVVLSQVNRAAEKSGMPSLGDIAWAPAAEKFASLVLMLHHPHTHWNQTDRDGPEPDLKDYRVLVRKNTRGDVGGLRLQWHKHLLRFDSAVVNEYRVPYNDPHPF